MNTAYFAGLFDGEGSVGIYRYNKKRNGQTPKLTVQIGMNDRRPLALIHEQYPESWLGEHENRWGKTWKLMFPSREGATRFLSDIRPYLVSKQDQVDLALEFSQIPSKRGVRPDSDTLERMFELADRLKTLKGRAELST